MAEGILRKNLPERLKLKVDVNSAGTHANEGQTAEPLAVSAAREIGVDISTHQSTAAKSDVLKESDLILVMEEMHTAFVKAMMAHHGLQVHLLGQYHPAGSALEIPDPYGGNLNQYRHCLKLIRECLPPAIEFLNSTLS
jgi:protein-tyrosine-phosphatase